jgi:NIPSNAP
LASFPFAARRWNAVQFLSLALQPAETLVPLGESAACVTARDRRDCAPRDAVANRHRAREEDARMALYEMRTYTLYVGKMAEATKLYQELGFPALQKGGHDRKLIGYFQGDTGMINQLVHLWKFDDDADRRKHWAGVFANKDFVEGFASKFRPLVMSQEVKLLTAAPWGPHP